MGRRDESRTWWQRHFGDTTRGRIVALLRREQMTVEELANELGVTDNAVRAHLIALERESVVRPTEIRRDGRVGKPATLYAIAPEATTRFSRAYAPVLTALTAELGGRLTPAELRALMRGVGRRLAERTSSRAACPPTFDGRVRSAVALLQDLGAEADLVRTADGYAIHGYGCPLSSVVAICPETCQAVEQLLSSVTGGRVREECDSNGSPSCRFSVTSSSP